MIKLSLTVEVLRLSIDLSNFQHQLRLLCCLESISECAIQFHVIEVFVFRQVFDEFLRLWLVPLDLEFGTL